MASRSAALAYCAARLVSIADPDARPIRKGKLGNPTEFGYVAQICEVTENTRKRARGGHEGMRTWTSWAILACDLDTLALRAG